jgi:hypothetical protein
MDDKVEAGENGNLGPMGKGKVPENHGRRIRRDRFGPAPDRR